MANQTRFSPEVDERVAGILSFREVIQAAVKTAGCSAREQVHIRLVAVDAVLLLPGEFCHDAEIH